MAEDLKMPDNFSEAAKHVVVHEAEAEKHNFWYVKELGYKNRKNAAAASQVLFGLKEHEVQKRGVRRLLRYLTVAIFPNYSHICDLLTH